MTYFSLMFFIHYVIILDTFKFTSSVLFGTHFLLDKKLRVLQLPLHLSKSRINGH